MKNNNRIVLMENFAHVIAQRCFRLSRFTNLLAHDLIKLYDVICQSLKLHFAPSRGVQVHDRSFCGEKAIHQSKSRNSGADRELLQWKT